MLLVVLSRLVLYCSMVKLRLVVVGSVSCVLISVVSVLQWARFLLVVG